MNPSLAHFIVRKNPNLVYCAIRSKHAIRHVDKLSKADRHTVIMLGAIGERILQEDRYNSASAKTITTQYNSIASRYLEVKQLSLHSRTTYTKRLNQAKEQKLIKIDLSFEERRIFLKLDEIEKQFPFVFDVALLIFKKTKPKEFGKLQNQYDAMLKNQAQKTTASAFYEPNKYTALNTASSPVNTESMNEKVYIELKEQELKRAKDHKQHAEKNSISGFSTEQRFFVVGKRFKLHKKRAFELCHALAAAKKYRDPIAKLKVFSADMAREFEDIHEANGLTIPVKIRGFLKWIKGIHYKIKRNSYQSNGRAREIEDNWQREKFSNVESSNAVISEFDSYQTYDENYEYHSPQVSCYQSQAQAFVPSSDYVAPESIRNAIENGGLMNFLKSLKK